MRIILPTEAQWKYIAPQFPTQYFIADPNGVRIELMQLMPESKQAEALNG